LTLARFDDYCRDTWETPQTLGNATQVSPIAGWVAEGTVPKLTAVTVANWRPTEHRQEIRDSACVGFYLIVQPTGKKVFAGRYRHSGKAKKYTCAPGSSLAAARAEWTAALHDLERGVDPGAEKRKRKQEKKSARIVALANTFEAIATNFLVREGAKLRSRDYYFRTLQRLVYPTFGATPIGQIKRKHLVALLDQIEDVNGATMANQTLAVIRRVMAWHAARDDDFVSPVVRGLSRIKPQDHRRKRILDDNELRAVWRTAEKRNDSFAVYLRFLLLTAARRDEARSMSWSEVNDGVWTVPGARNKVKVDLARPLSNQVMALIKAQPRVEHCPFIFSTTGNKAISSLSRYKRDFDGACGITGWTLHDLRRTARSLLSRAGIRPDIAERCLGHTVGDGVQQTYDRHSYVPELRHAFEALAMQIERIVDPPPGNVTELRAGTGA
jgi:integrase